MSQIIGPVFNFLAGTSQRAAEPIRVPMLRKKTPSYLEETPIHRVNPCQQAKLPLFVQLKNTNFESLPIKSDVLLPNCWNSKDKSQFMELTNGSLVVTYQGNGKSDIDAASIRGNRAIPMICGVFYYEVTIISKGRDGYIGIGFCSDSVSLGRLPGWEDYSWGYHGDDGHSFCCSGTGKAYGPTFTTGDVIGVVINFLTNTAGFTKNGVYLGPAFKDFMTGKKLVKLYPAVGLRTPGEIVEANFGARPFKFDIQGYFKQEKLKLKDAVESVVLPSLSSKCSDEPLTEINHLIFSYLVHKGYTNTAASFFDGSGLRTTMNESNNLNYMSGEFPESEAAKIRQGIINMVVQGKIDEAIIQLQNYFPSVLESHISVKFQLYCLKYIQLVVKMAPAESDDMDTDSPKDIILETVLSHGRGMYTIFGDIDNSTFKNALIETFSLISYVNPMDSPLSHLLDPNNRQIVADNLNSVILETMGLPKRSAFEMLVRQTMVVNQELLEQEHGATAFLNLSKDYFDGPA